MPISVTQVAARASRGREQSLEALALTNRQYRLQILEDLAQRAGAIMTERGAAMRDVPGGGTGLLAAVPRRDGIEYRFDRALSAELRDLGKQAAQECGQWAEAGNVATHQAAIIILPAPGPDARLPAAPQEACVLDVGPLPSCLPEPVALDDGAEDLEPEYRARGPVEDQPDDTE